MYQHLSEQCRNSFEQAVLSLHLYTVAEGWECTGLAEDDPESSEMLPAHWNQNAQLFSFRYKRSGTVLLLKFLRPSPSTLSVHGLRTDQNDKIFSTSLDLAQFESRLDSDTIANVLEQTLCRKFTDDVLNKLKETKKSSLLIASHPAPQANPYAPGNPYMPPRANPLGQGIPANPGFQPYPGNLMGPEHPLFGQQPNPRVRWDPLNPTGMPEFPDHLPPPGPFGFQDPRGFF